MSASYEGLRSIPPIGWKSRHTSAGSPSRASQLRTISASSVGRRHGEALLGGPAPGLVDLVGLGLRSLRGGHVLLHGRLPPHHGVHLREEQAGAGRGEERRGRGRVGQAQGRAGDAVGRRREHDDVPCPQRQLDGIHALRPLGEDLVGEPAHDLRSHEALRAGRHQHPEAVRHRLAQADGIGRQRDRPARARGDHHSSPWRSPGASRRPWSCQLLSGSRGPSEGLTRHEPGPPGLGCFGAASSRRGWAHWPRTCRITSLPVAGVETGVGQNGQFPGGGTGVPGADPRGRMKVT
jgi:hypothetical protein